MTPIAFNLTDRLKAVLPGDRRYSTLLALYEALQEAAVFEVVAAEASPKPDPDGWIPHKAGDPMPCAPDTRIQVKCRDGYTDKGPAFSFGRPKNSTDWWSGECDWKSAIVCWRALRDEP